MAIGPEGIFISKARKKAIDMWPVPERTDLLASKMRKGRRSVNKDGKTGVRSFLGVCGFFRKFVKGYATIARPLTDMLKAEQPFMWLKQHQLAFERLKAAITSADVLQIPSTDPSHPIEVIPDSSKVAIGGVLLQDQGRGMRPCWFWSQRLSDAESTLIWAQQTSHALAA